MLCKQMRSRSWTTVSPEATVTLWTLLPTVLSVSEDLSRATKPSKGNGPMLTVKPGGGLLTLQFSVTASLLDCTVKGPLQVKGVGVDTGAWPTPSMLLDSSLSCPCSRLTVPLAVKRNNPV